MAPQNETDRRLQIFNSFLTTPHREVKETVKLHLDVLKNDPLFYGHLAVWYMKTGEIRDHKQVFTAVLLNSLYPGHRDAGRYFLRQMPVHEVRRVEEYYRLHLNSGKLLGTKTLTPKPGSNKTSTRTVGGYVAKGNFSTAGRQELINYWWEQESDRSRLDRTLLFSKKDVRELIRKYRIPHSEYVDKILFQDDPPAGSVFFTLKTIAKMENPTEQARLILENKIPFRVALSVLKKLTPAAWVAVVEGMSPQDVLNHMSMFKEHGVLENKDLKSLVDKKIKSAETNKNVSALKVKDVLKAAKLSESDTAALEEVANKQIKAKGRINRSTAILVDKSASLDQAIDVAKQLGAMISTIMADGTPLAVIAFDNMPYEIKVGGTKSFADWEKAFQGIHAQGRTACGAGLALMTRNKLRVEQIVLITDECENATPNFVPAFQEYVKMAGEAPHVIIVRVGGFQRHIELACQKADISLDTYEIEKASDKYSFTGLIPLLQRRSKLDILMDVMAEELPARPKPVPVPAAVRARQAELRGETVSA